MKNILLLTLFILIACDEVGDSNDKYESKAVQTGEIEEIDLVADFEASSFSIAFGSDNNENGSQEKWSWIANNMPDVWIWLGNSISQHDTLNSAYQIYCALNFLEKDKYYSEFSALIPNKLGVYSNAEIASNPNILDTIKNVYADFLKIPKQSSIRNRDGFYNSYNLGKANNSIKIILLDTKTFNINESRSVLGRDQWDWFENIMNNSKANVVLIASEMPLDDEKSDNWQKNEQAYRKLISLIESTKSNSCFILSPSEKPKFEQIGGFKKTITAISPGKLSYTEIIKDSLDKETENPAYFGLLKIDFNPKATTATYLVKGAGNLTLDSNIIELKR